jgi:hypothetical protein
MKLKIIGPDNRVVIDGETFPVNLAAFGWHPAYHAVQYDDDTGSGEVEWRPMGGVSPPNIKINRDQLMGMFGGVVEHTKNMLVAKRALEDAKKAGAS